MRNSDNDSNGDQSEALNKLIAQAGKLKDKSFRRPSEEVIDAYLLGTATDAQKAEVHSSLRASSDFRREILALAIDLDQLNDPELRKAYDSLKVEPMPDLSQRTALVDQNKTFLHRRIEETPSKPRSGQTFFRLVPVLSAAAIVVLAFVVYHRMSTPVSIPPVSTPLNQESTRVATDTVHKTSEPVMTSLRENNPNVPPQAFSEFATRGGPTYQRDRSRWEDSTALSAISKSLELDPSTYLYHSVRQQTASIGRIVVKLMDTSRQTARIVLLDAPQHCDSCTVWILSLPGSARYPLLSAPLAGDTLNIPWTARMGTEGVITLTYRVGNQFHAVPAQSFKL